MTTEELYEKLELIQKIKCETATCTEVLSKSETIVAR